MIRRPGAIVGAVVLSLALGGGGARAAEVDRETLDKVTAAFVLNFVRFTEWPPERFADEESPIRIAVVGEAGLLPYLRALAEEEVVNGRRLEIHAMHPPDPEDDEAWAAFAAAVRRCHVAFVAGRVFRSVRREVEPMIDAGMLTISDADDFVRHGGMLELYVHRDRLVFDANQEAMERAGVTLSSKVLRLAQRVKGGD